MSSASLLPLNPRRGTSAGSLAALSSQRGSPRWKLLTPKKQLLLRSFVGRRWKLMLVCVVVVVMSVVQLVSIINSQVDRQTLGLRGVIRLNVPQARYQQAEAAKASMARTQMFSGLTPDTLQQRLPVWVISLARAPHRRQNAVDSLKAAGVSNYELIDAVDFHNASSVSKEHLHRYLHGWRLYMWQHNRTYYSSKLAVDLSHFRLWERVAASDNPVLIVEDDVRLTGAANWTRDMLTVLNELPEDWDVLYLGATFPNTLGHNITQHLKPVFGTAGAFAYVLTPRFAKAAVAAAADPRQNTWVDLMLLLMARHMEGSMYIADPPLVGLAGFESTLNAHYASAPRTTWWERLWMKYKHGFVARRRRLAY